MPYLDLDRGKEWHKRGIWPCSWIAIPGPKEPPFVVAYRLRFRLKSAASFRAHVTADERYELYVDGEFMGRGSERGDGDNWFFESYDLKLAAGNHTIVARAWTLGHAATIAQMSLRHGFIFSPEGKYTETLGTGKARWQAKLLGGFAFHPPLYAFGTGHKLVIDAKRFDWGFERGAGAGWKDVVVVENAGSAGILADSDLNHGLTPATLLPQMERVCNPGRVRLVARVASCDTACTPVLSADHLYGEAGAWERLVLGRGKVVVPANTRRRVLLDLENYYCARPEMVTTGGDGSRINVKWAESLYELPEGGKGYTGWAPGRNKGNRDEVEGKYFSGIGDIFRPDGGTKRRFTPLWWQAGRYVEILVETGRKPLTLESFALRETRYPLEMEGSFEADDPRPAEFIPIGVRSLQMCSHETYMDCPYYEQLMYVGDTRLECLTTYSITRDARLPRKAVRVFDFSRLTSGITQSRYPSRFRQVIPPFSLWWVGMVHDFAFWRGDTESVRGHLRGVRQVIDWFQATLNKDGLVEAPKGWNFMDWVPTWPGGIPADGDKGVSGILNWHFVLALNMAADLERMAGDPEMARRADRMASELAARTTNAFWSAKRGLMADNLRKTRFSEHAQCLAILTRRVDAGKRAKIAHGLLEAPDLFRTTIYFMHYLFETYRLLGRMDALWKRLDLWFSHKRMGLKTTLEMPEPSRSDCHAWATHPIFHFYGTILGIRPTSMGFNTVSIAPQFGHLKRIKGRLPHPKGFISADLRLEGSRMRGTITLPAGITGVFNYGAKRKTLKSGKNRI